MPGSRRRRGSVPPRWQSGVCRLPRKHSRAPAASRRPSVGGGSTWTDSPRGWAGSGTSTGWGSRPGVPAPATTHCWPHSGSCALRDCRLRTSSRSTSTPTGPRRSTAATSGRWSATSPARSSASTSRWPCGSSSANDPVHYAAFERAGFDVPEVTRVAERVRVFIGDAQERAFRSAPSARVVAHLQDGREVSATASPPGAPHDPFDWPDVEHKAHRLADPAVSPRTVDRMVAAARSWERTDVPVAGSLPWTDLERSGQAL
jgi:hypothetical protein